MHNRSAKSLLVAGAGAIAAVAFTTAPFDAARADTCLSAPNGPTPAGSHWYYRTDHANKRKCWYVRKVDAAPAAVAAAEPGAADPAGNDRASTAAPASPSSKPEIPAASTPPAASSAQTATAPIRSSVADARAEYVAPHQPAPAPGPGNAATSSPFPEPVWAPPTESAQQTAAPAPEAAPGAPPPTMNERWSDPVAGGLPANANVTDKLRKAAKPVAKSAPASTADGSMSASTLATLIGALLAALAVAGGIAAVLMKFGRSEPIARREPGERPDLWAGRTELVDTGIYAQDFRSSPIDLDAPSHRPAAQRAVEYPVQDEDENEPPAWIKAARQRHVANDRVRPGAADTRAAVRGDLEPQSALEPQRASEATGDPVRDVRPPAADEIEQLLALAQKRSAA
ncbi:hypothetical protein [Rhodopseudomonas palustris]|uniref:Uncharacterized protein n=1 Tax=Rhodopseudomonas palustris (strain DX-1) TaxID=652103 RepID=E6VDL6_RHOPX|nr:hypothetical protein [Rhodopseudomonas palustris]